LKLNTYQEKALATAIFPKEVAFSYLPLKLAGEAGEVAEKFGKLFRKYGPDIPVGIEDVHKELAKELGDVLWYVAVLGNQLGYSLEQIAEINIDKLSSRKDRGVLEGSGDNR